MSDRSCRRRAPRRLPYLAAAVLVGLFGSVTLASGADAAPAASNLAAARSNASSGPYTNSLDHMSCISATFCVAVGGYEFTYDGRQTGGTLAEEWNGGSWTVLDTPNPAMPGYNDGYLSTFSGVSCTSTTFCAAVGSSSSNAPTNTLAELWDGSNWSIPSTPNSELGASFSSVSCVSATFCLAVGTYDRDQPLGAEWDGTTWTQVTLAVPEGANSTYPDQIQCLSDDFCLVVGSYSEAGGGDTSNLIEEWNGSTWTVVSAPDPTNDTEPWLSDVSCSSDTSCVAVGQGFADVLDGTTWSIETVPSAAGATQDQLEGVSCVSTTFCATVGTYWNGTNWVSQSATWDGSEWTLQTTAHPKKTVRAGLADVACFSSSSCLTVGGVVVDMDHVETGSALLEQWDGSTWSNQLAPAVVPLMISPDEGKRGEKVSIVGTGFSPNSNVRVSYKGSSVSTLCKATTDADGTYTCSARIPEGSPAGSDGSHFLIAKNGPSLSLIGTFTLT